MKKYIQMVLTTDEVINLELLEEYAPKSVANFIDLVEHHFYDGIIFHRIIKDFMIQTGGYKIEDGSLVEVEAPRTIEGEFKSNHHPENTLHHECGVISMARTSDPNSASSQIFICSSDDPWLDGEYAAFGRTTDEESNEVIRRVSYVETCRPHPMFADFPVEVIGIKTILLSDNRFER